LRLASSLSTSGKLTSSRAGLTDQQADHKRQAEQHHAEDRDKRQHDGREQESARAKATPRERHDVELVPCVDGDRIVPAFSLDLRAELRGVAAGNKLLAEVA